MKNLSIWKVIIALFRESGMEFSSFSCSFSLLYLSLPGLFTFNRSQDGEHTACVAFFFSMSIFRGFISGDKYFGSLGFISDYYDGMVCFGR